MGGNRGCAIFCGVLWGAVMVLIMALGIHLVTYDEDHRLANIQTYNQVVDDWTNIHRPAFMNKTGSYKVDPVMKKIVSSPDGNETNSSTSFIALTRSISDLDAGDALDDERDSTDQVWVQEYVPLVYTAKKDLGPKNLDNLNRMRTNWTDSNGTAIAGASPLIGVRGAYWSAEPTCQYLKDIKLVRTLDEGGKLSTDPFDYFAASEPLQPTPTPTSEPDSDPEDSGDSILNIPGVPIANAIQSDQSLSPLDSSHPATPHFAWDKAHMTGMERSMSAASASSLSPLSAAAMAAVADDPWTGLLQMSMTTWSSSASLPPSRGHGMDAAALLETGTGRSTTSRSRSSRTHERSSRKNCKAVCREMSGTFWEQSGSSAYELSRMTCQLGAVLEKVCLTVDETAKAVDTSPKGGDADNATPEGLTGPGCFFVKGKGWTPNAYKAISTPCANQKKSVPVEFMVRSKYDPYYTLVAMDGSFGPTLESVNRAGWIIVAIGVGCLMLTLCCAVTIFKICCAPSKRSGSREEPMVTAMYTNTSHDGVVGAVPIDDQDTQSPLLGK